MQQSRRYNPPHKSAKLEEPEKNTSVWNLIYLDINPYPPILFTISFSHISEDNSHETHGHKIASSSGHEHRREEEGEATDIQCNLMCKVVVAEAEVVDERSEKVYF